MQGWRCMGRVAPPMIAEQGVADRLLRVWTECHAALDGLARCTGDPALHVHTLRKRGKRLRGGLDLVGAPKRIKAELRDLGRLLGPARDAAVRAATLRQLRESPGESFKEDGALPVVVALLAEEAAVAEGTPPAPVLAFVAERLAGVVAWLRESLPQEATDPVERLRRMGGRADNALARVCRKKAAGRHFHEARKAVKRLHGALWFLFPEPDCAGGQFMKHLVALGEDLGGIQDLEVFAAWLDRSGLTSARLPGLHRALARGRRRLVARVKRRAAGFDALAFPRPAGTVPIA